MNIEELVTASYAIAQAHGWWDDNKSRNVGEALALIHSEVSEALEEWRIGWPLEEIHFVPDAEGAMIPEGFPIEFADILIRIADLCGGWGIDLEEAVKIKMNYNAQRPYRHGGKKA